MDNLTSLAMENATGKRQMQVSAKPLIIAGPCSAESPEQLLETAISLRIKGNVDFLRAGLWKPRTSPDSFQGVGGEGLRWLKEVKAETGMNVATEVGCEKHVFEALKYDVDLLWIGARTVSNPFVVQEIAESLRGVDIPVLVKNPLNPDVELWYGAINRLLKAGVKEVGAIHRGFSIWGRSIYRNPPIWKIAAELREMIPGILIINDPSHIAGKRSLVPVVSRRAMEEGANGLMIEVHPEPDRAMSDAAQQITPETFSEILNTLGIGTGYSPEKADSSVDDLNLEIDMVDDLLIHTIANRMELSRQIAKAGDRGGDRLPKPGNWDVTLKRLLGLAREDGLTPGFVHRLFDEIQKESLHHRTAGSGRVDK